MASVNELEKPDLTSSDRPVFPAQQVLDCLKDELIEAVKAEASVKGIALPPDPGAIASTPFQVDSLVVVDIVCAVEPIIGFPLPDDVVRPGGYRSIQSALEHLLPKIETHWKKHKE